MSRLFKKEVSVGGSEAKLRAGDDVVLEVFGQDGELADISSNTDQKVRIFLRVFLCLSQHSGVDYIELDVVASKFHEDIDQGYKLF